MRAIWKGSISFGLVSIGVKLYAATEEKDVSFHQVRRSDGSASILWAARRRCWRMYFATPPTGSKSS